MRRKTSPRDIRDDAQTVHVIRCKLLSMMITTNKGDDIP